MERIIIFLICRFLCVNVLGSSIHIHFILNFHKHDLDIAFTILLMEYIYNIHTYS